MPRNPSPQGPLPEAVELADRLHSAAIHLLRRLRKQDDRAGISAARLSALSVVVFAGPVTMGQLAAAEQVAPPTMTRLVGAMERDGLVERRADADDGRVVWIHARPKGTRVLHAARERRVVTLATDLAALAPAEWILLAAAAGFIERLGSES